MSNKIRIKKKKGSLAKQQQKKYLLRSKTFQKELQLAAKYLHAKQPTKAANTYYRILIHDPQHLQANYFLGRLFHRAGRSDLGIPYLKKVIELQPEYIDAQLALSDMLRSMGRSKESLNILKALTKQEPREAKVFFALGRLYQQLGKFEEAVANFKCVLTLNPKMVHALTSQGRIYAAQGETITALQLFRRALAIRPGFGEAHYGIALLQKHDNYSDDIHFMEEAYSKRSKSEEDKIYLCFALGKIFDDLKQYDKAFHFFSEGNKRKRESFPAPYSIAQEVSHFSKIKKAFDSKFITKTKQIGVESPCPIFIIGLPRSGTSLVEQILASHSLVCGAGELQDINILVKIISVISGNSFPEGVEKLNDDNWRKLADNYLDSLKGKGTEPYITDKMPHNFRYVGMISALFPKAKIIHCRRAPLATLFSIFRQHFSMSHGYASDLKELGEYYLLYQDLMAYWEQLLPARLYNLQYEELVNNPEEEIRKLLSHCGLQFEEECLSFFKNKRSVSTPSASQVRQPIYKTAVEHWQHYEGQLSPLKHALRK